MAKMQGWGAMHGVAADTCATVPGRSHCVVCVMGCMVGGGGAGDDTWATVPGRSHCISSKHNSRTEGALWLLQNSAKPSQALRAGLRSAGGTGLHLHMCIYPHTSPPALGVYIGKHSYIYF